MASLPGQLGKASPHASPCVVEGHHGWRWPWGLVGPLPCPFPHVHGEVVLLAFYQPSQTWSLSPMGPISAWTLQHKIFTTVVHHDIKFFPYLPTCSDTNAYIKRPNGQMNLFVQLAQINHPRKIKFGKAPLNLQPGSTHPFSWPAWLCLGYWQCPCSPWQSRHRQNL